MRTLHPNVLLPALTCLLGFAFAALLLARYARRRQTYVMVWLVGLLWYAVAAGTEALGAALGWTAGLYRVWYVSGAIGVAAYLGAGTIYLHRKPGFGSLVVVSLLVGCIPALATRHTAVGLAGLGLALLLTLVLGLRQPWFAHAVLTVLVVATIVAAVIIARAPVDAGLLPATPDEVVSGQAFDAETRALTPAFNITGAMVLVLGALSSALSYARTRSQPNRVASNVLIALGAFIPSLGTGLTRFGVTSIFFIGELLGLMCIFAGFLISDGRARVRRAGPAENALRLS